MEKTHRVVIADETHQSCGVAAEIAARIAETGFDKLKTGIRRVSTLDVPVPYSPRSKRISAHPSRASWTPCARRWRKNWFRVR